MLYELCFKLSNKIDRCVVQNKQISAFLNSRGGLPWEVVGDTMDHFEKNNKVAVEFIKYVRWPRFYFGTNLYVPGWSFNNIAVQGISSEAFFKQSLRIAKTRANLKGDFGDLKDNDKSIALAWTLSAHVNCTTYSPEMDPRFKDNPSESFAPLRLRGLGDCEDAAW